MWCLAGASLEGVGELVWVLLVEVFFEQDGGYYFVC